MTMLERCAWALLFCKPTDFSSELAVKKAEVRAVLAALREPDNALVAQFADKWREINDSDETVYRADASKRIWQVMIDTILEDDAETG